MIIVLSFFWNFFLLFYCAYFKFGSSLQEECHTKFNYFGDYAASGRKLQNNLLSIPQSPHLKTGTTIVGICCRDGVVLGADTRSTGGPLVMDKNKHKIHPIAKSILCCAAGTSADCDQVTRKTSHFLGLVRIEKELANEYDYSNRDSLRTAVTHISNTIRAGKLNRRKIQTVLILGGVDLDGPGLYQIDADGVPLRISFGALGSGCTDALAVLESARHSWCTKNHGIPNPVDSNIALNKHAYCEDISVEEATHVVRRAVQAGILNDLGSGSHVDLCVITQTETKIWRESLVSSWDSDRIDYKQHKHLTSANSANEQTRSSAFADVNVNAHLSTEQSQSKGKDFLLGKLIFSRRRVQERMTENSDVKKGHKVQGTIAAGREDLGLDIDIIE